MKPTKENLLTEKFWENLKGAARSVGTAAKEVAKVVAPEVTDPITNAVGRVKDIGSKISKSARTKDQNAILFLRDMGYILLPGGKINWQGKNGNVGTAKVGELDFRDGKPVLGGRYNNPRIVIQHIGDGNFKIVKQPYRHTAKPTFQNP